MKLNPIQSLRVKRACMRTKFPDRQHFHDAVTRRTGEGGGEKQEMLSCRRYTLDVTRYRIVDMKEGNLATCTVTPDHNGICYGVPILFVLINRIRFSLFLYPLNVLKSALTTGLFGREKPWKTTPKTPKAKIQKIIIIKKKEILQSKKKKAALISTVIVTGHDDMHGPFQVMVRHEPL